MVIDFFILKLSKTITSNDYLLFSKFIRIDSTGLVFWVWFLFSLSFSGSELVLSLKQMLIFVVMMTKLKNMYSLGLK